MSNIFVNINAIAYVLLLVLAWYKRKTFDIYVLLVFLYAFTAVMCVGNFYSEREGYWTLGIGAFIYLFIVLLIFLYPIKHFSLESKKFIFKDNGYYVTLSIIFIFFAIYDIITSFGHTQEIIQSGAYADLRLQAYTDAESVEYYSSGFQRFAKNTNSYLKPFAIAYFYNKLTQEKTNKFFIIALFVAIVAPSFIAAVADASRAMLVIIASQLAIGYFIYKQSIPRSRKRLLMFGALAVLAVFIAYSLAVTVSRFGDEANNSLFFYFGHSMLAFNDGVFYSMTQFSCGSKFLDWFVSLFGLESYFPRAMGVTRPGAFITFIGSLFTDFGFWGTPLIALLGVFIMNRFFTKPYIKMSNTIMIIFYCTTIANGIFVSPLHRGLSWLMTFVVYFIVKLGERSVTKQK